ncbi:FapA family protein [Desulfothermus okinawensis JCM 13304]
MDFYNLGYVQNVIRNQVIAEFLEISPEEVDKYDERFIYKERNFPIGSNCAVNPKNPNQLISLVNGYVFYDEKGNISVKNLLNVRGNVDFHTGNIYFVNNVVVHGDVKSGFEVQGNSILVKGIVEGAKLRALNSILIEGGVKGESKAVLKAENNIHCRYCENGTLLAKRSILIDKHCLHSNLYTGKNIKVGERLIGGNIYCGEKILIEGELGGGFNVPTVLVLGYDPVDMYKFSDIEMRLENLHKRLDFLQVKRESKSDPEIVLEIQEITKKIKVLSNHLNRIARSIKTKDFKKCRVIVRGTIHPGVEISIGPAYYKVDEFIKGTHFYFKDGEVIVSRFEKLKGYE